MDTLKILQTSDICLDHVLTDYRRDIRKIRRNELLDTFSFLIDQALKNEVDLFCIAGDIISANSVAKSTLERIKEGFRVLNEAGIHVIGVLGEKDETDDISSLQNMFSQKMCHLFTENEWSKYTKLEGVTVYGIRSSGEDVKRPRLKGFHAEGMGMKVGILHGTFMGTPNLNEFICPVSSRDLDESGLDYLALGHYPNMVNCSTSKTTSWYSGSPVHHGFDTRGERHVLIVNIKGRNVKVSPIIVPERSHRVVHMDITEKNIADVKNHLDKISSKEACVRLEISGIWNYETEPFIQNVLENFSKDFFYFDVIDKTSVISKDDVAKGHRGILDVNGRRVERGPHEFFMGKMAKFRKPEEESVDEFLKIRALKMGLKALGEVYEREIGENVHIS